MPEPSKKPSGYSQAELVSIIPGKRSRNTDEPDSNPASLAGQISMKDMGSRVQSAPATERAPPKEETTKQQAAPILQNDLGFENIGYRPTTVENNDIFEKLTAEVRTHIPDELHSVILSAADMILEALKNDNTSINEKRSEVESLLSTKLDNTLLGELVAIAKQITDYDQKDEEKEDSESAIAVVFDEDDATEPEVADVEPEVTERETAQEIEERDAVVTTADTSSSSLIPLADIKKDFFFARLSALEPDMEPSEVRELVKKVSKITSDKSLISAALEAQLMETFQYKHLEFVKICMENRWRIVFQLQKLMGREEHALSEMKELGLTSLLAEFGGEVDKKRKNLEDHTDSKRVKVTEAREPQIIDLEGLVFEQGHHLMASAKIYLPKGSYQQNKKLYDIISVPAPAGPPSLEESNERLVSISEMPEWAQAAFLFGETTTLNRIQSKIYPKAFESDDNLLLCAPTGAGKTNVAMLSMLRVLGNYRNPETGRFDLRSFKAVYVAPLKALVSEQMREFQRRLTAQFGVVVNELTGDLSLSQKEIAETQVLVTTPEKWDVVTRKATEQLYAQLVKLLIIDEIHLLHDDRGPVLESIIIRAKRNPDTRLVGLSATLPNYEDVARFLNVDLKSGLFFFDALYRPCPLEQQYVGIKEKKAIKKVAAMNEACYDKLVESVRNRHQMIIFVHSRKDTFKTAKWLRDKIADEDVSVLRPGAGTQEILKQEAENAQNRNLADILPSGFGIHHAGLNKDDRSVVEDLFAQGHIQVLVSTATLAWGVNLPAHTVIIKGTDTYSAEKGCWVQLSPQDILQMLGRAGRPRYDKSGEGVIITAQDELQYYLAILNQQLPIESQLMSKLADNLNAEVVLGAIKSREDAVEWLGQTYLYIRMLKSPKLYQVGPDYADDKTLYWKRVDLVHSALVLLQEHKLVNYDQVSGSIVPTELGKVAAHFYIGYTTIGAYNTRLKPWMTELDVLRIFAGSGEFKYVPVRQEEKLEVAKLADKCPIPIKETPTDPLAKVNVLIQAYVSRLQLEGFALMADMIYVTQSAGRLLRAIHEICLRKNWAQLALVTLNLCKVVERRMWNTSSPFRQFGDLAPKEIIRATEASHLPFMSYFNFSAAELAEAINFKGHSQKAHDLLRQFPKLELECQAQPISQDLVRVTVDITPDWDWNRKLHGGSELFLMIVEDCDGEHILYDDMVKITAKQAGRGVSVDFTVSVSDPLSPNYYVTLASEKWLHSQWRVPVKMFDMKLPKKASSSTELLDVQSVPVGALKNEALSNTFDFAYFNKFQSQCFHSLWNTNDNVFLGLTKGSGKTACGELAILNHWRQNKQRILYLQPSQELVDEKLKLWSKKYADITDPPKAIAKLTGELASDIKIQAQSHLVLATPEQFDLLSRRWRQRKSVQQLDLVVADDVHLVGNGSAGVVYETVLSRLRFMAAHMERDLRIVALSQPLLNGRDVGEWLGCSKTSIFNFEPSQRFHAIQEIRLQPYTDSKIISLARPCAEFLALNKNLLVFVPSRKVAMELTPKLIELLSEPFAMSDDLEPYLEKITDKSLKQALEQGIGFFFPSMNARDRLIVERLFSSKMISVLMATKDSAKFAPQSENVVIYGSQESGQSGDYLINDVLEMVGCCVRGKVLAFVYGPKVPYYSKFLATRLPVESYLNLTMHDAFVHEISTKTFLSKQDCIDWLTYTYFYRRLAQNPSFYGLVDTTHVGVSEYLSELVETTLKDLSDAGLIELGDEEEEDEEEEEMSPLNGAMIASHYNVSFASMKILGELSGRSRLRNIIEAVTSASEFDTLPVRPEDETSLAKVMTKVPLKVASDSDLESPHVKAFLLLQAHLSRIQLPADLASDQQIVLSKILSLVYASTDTLSSEGHLSALQAMDLSQMVVQGMWNRDSPLLQIPHVTPQMLQRCKKHEVETVYDIMSLEDDDRDDVLQLEGDDLQDVAEFVNKYPNVDVLYEIDLEEPFKANEPKTITVTIERDEEMDDLAAASPFPFAKTEGWWVVIGDAELRQLYAIKKTQVAAETQLVSLEVTLPSAGHHNLTVWCMCDSYVDADKEMEVEVDVE